jgi:hypothetical protein
MAEHEKEECDRLHAILERVDAATDDVLEAARSNDPVRMKAVLVHWFGVLYDEGRHRIHQVEQHNETLQQVIERLKQMNARLRARTRPPDRR